MPLRFLQECPNSTGFHRNGTGIRWNETGIHKNSCIPAGMELESAGMTVFLQESRGMGYL